MYRSRREESEMAVIEEVLRKKEEQWEERSLNLLDGSKIDQEFSAVMHRKRGVRRHQLKWLGKPMGIPEVIVELQDQDRRESALRALSNFLLEKREEDAENYNRAGFLLFNSCGTMTILLQEVLSFYWKMTYGTHTVRSSKRLANVLTLLQAIAANSEIRRKFVTIGILNFLVPLIMFKSEEETFRNVQAISLSVLGILCQGREPHIIQWATENDIVDACCFAIKFGNELSKVVAMHILEAVLQDTAGLNYIFYRMDEKLLLDLLKTLKNLAYISYFLYRGLELLLEFLPGALSDGSLTEVMEEFPIIKKLHKQLLVNIGKKFEISPINKCHEFFHNPIEETTILSNLWYPVSNLMSAVTTPQCVSSFCQPYVAATYQLFPQPHLIGEASASFRTPPGKRSSPSWGW
ncbi:hypothetical protein H6P81_017296 [Aristolochia fimbriata]|uniref:Uncharacterized protein n=1 Tax=Aristolochia fimbriata TaxID=158543 RepID=A0AAV7DXY7_ARIFI|nr:hypothetical protein H6P81_017296 [Aristolochia fimbriata]